MDAAMETKLRELIDRSEIWQVMQRYGRGLDRLDVELARSCYFDDAIEDHGDYVGAPDDFIAWANMTSETFIDYHHGLMNHSCELDGDNAYCETYYLFTGVARKAPHLLSMGRYIDHFQKRNGEWRIANRVALIEKNFELADASLWPTRSRADVPDLPVGTHDRSDVSYHRPPRPRTPPKR
jgi:hypothetical protein